MNTRKSKYELLFKPIEFKQEKLDDKVDLGLKFNYSIFQEEESKMFIKIRLKTNKLVDFLIKEKDLLEEKAKESELEYQIVDNFLSKDFIKSIKNLSKEVYLEDKLLGHLSTIRYTSGEDLFIFSLQIDDEELFYNYLGLIKGDKKKTIFDLVGTHTMKVDWDLEENESRYKISNPKFYYQRKKKGT